MSLSGFCRLSSGSAAFISAALLSAFSADFEVTNTADRGQGSLRQAIEDANDNPGSDRIVFNVPGSSVHRIVPATPLPLVTDPVMVDGYTQPGSQMNTLSNGENAVLLIQLDGVLLTPPAAGFSLRAGFSSVRGLVINRFPIGILLDSPSNAVVGNFIGPEPTGLTAWGNDEGIVLSGVCCNVIGGVAAAERNVIAGNSIHAILVSEEGFPPAIDTFILGNFINVTKTGLTRLPGNGTPIAVRSALRLTVGGLEPGAGNVIAPSGLGLHLYSANGTQILGNNIGVGVDGITSIGITNTIRALTSVDDIRIEANRIAFNREAVLVTGTRVTLTRNLIYSNTIWGINLGNAALTNDPGDTDLGPNELQNFPTLTSLRFDTNLVVQGVMDSKPTTTYTLEFFANQAPNPNGRGDGQVYLGSTSVTTPESGVTPFEVLFPSIPATFSWVAATATDPAGNTSTFSPAVQARSLTFVQIHSQPNSISLQPGMTAAFRVEVSGAPPFLYQWRRDGIDLSNATNAVLTLNNVQLSQRGAYTVQITNPFGTVESLPADLTILIMPLFVQQPISQTIAPGEYVTLSVQVANTATLPIGFFWRSNSTIISASAGSQYASFLTIRPTQLSTRFSVLATNGGDTRPSVMRGAILIRSFKNQSVRTR
jgi:hypothetical protein